MTADIRKLASPDVAEAVAANPVAVIPFGSIEQHGSHLPCGTDTLIADRLGEAVAERLNALYVPFGPYGVTPIHAGRPGTITLSPATFESLLAEICSELVRMGVRTIVFVNWHEMNSPSLDRVATDVQAAGGATMVVAHACYTAQRIYAEEGGELTHGGGIETLGVLAFAPELVHRDRAGKVSRPPRAADLDAMRRGHEVYGFVTDVGEFGGDGWYGDPTWASDEKSGDFAGRISQEVVRQVEHVLALRRGDATATAKEER